VVAALTNLVAAFYCVAPYWHSYWLAFMVVAFVAIPSVVVLGRAWLRLLPRSEAVSPRCRESAGYSVFLLALLPLVTFWTLWPLRVAFLAARPGMEVLADQVTAGTVTSVGFPQRVGPFQVVADDVYPRPNGYVGLITARKPLTGFVRLHPGRTRNSRGPIVGSKIDV
jgi:hypothetical protein